MNRFVFRSLPFLRAVGRQYRFDKNIGRTVVARFLSTTSPPSSPSSISPLDNPAFSHSSQPSPSPTVTDSLHSTPESPPSVIVNNSEYPVANVVTPEAATASINATPNVTEGTSNIADILTTDAAAVIADATEVTDAVANVTAAASSSWSDMMLTPATTLLTTMHDWTGLPWWGSIVLSTLVIRTTLLPVTLLTMKNSALMGALKDDIAERREAVMTAMKSGDRTLAAVRQAEMQTFMRDAGVAPLRVLVGPLAQFPVFVSLFVGIRRLALNDPSFATGGISWFSDLSVMDPYYVLPVICGGTLFAMTEMGGDTGAKMTPQMKMVMRSVAGLSIPMTYWFPTAVFCYWIPNNIFSVVLAKATRSATGQRVLGLKINPATIPGTRAFRQLEAMKVRGGNTITNEAIDPAIAAASYAKKPTIPSADTVKPVLMKTRPSKKKLKITRNKS